MEDVVGDNGLEIRNDRGERLMEQTNINDMLYGNNWFKQHKRQLYIYKSPDKKTFNQFDYMLINKRFSKALIQEM